LFEFVAVHWPVFSWSRDTGVFGKNLCEKEVGWAIPPNKEF
jgi:hypothetical protein